PALLLADEQVVLDIHQLKDIFRLTSKEQKNETMAFQHQSLCTQSDGGD
ncbi:hypothetical protein AAUPMC_11751, partial [Pasteurella multocida subsp. multocida str. Anand1_cattle]